MSVNLDTIVLNDDQTNALDKFVQFLCDPNSHVFVLKGYSGTGKSTLIKTLLDRLDSYVKATKALWPDYPDYRLQLTATTNKAADTFSKITGHEVRTIHSFLELTVKSDFKTGEKYLVPRQQDNYKHGYLLLIDEASYIDRNLLQLIFKQAIHCKIMLIGDPGQLLSPGSTMAPAFSAGFPEAMLSQVMRQLVDGKPKANPISDLATAFRHTVETGEWPKFRPDGQYVQYMERNDFNDAILQEFTRPGWAYHDSKVLAWTNQTCINYNNAIRNHLAGDPSLQVGDFAEVNSFISVNKQSLKTDQLVYISEIEPDCDLHGVPGNWVTVENSLRVFHPKSREVKKKHIALQRAAGDYHKVREAENWVDLRAVFAQTINKAQGSTYGTVFIDLDDVKKCNSGNQVARMMYVGVSRATTRVVLTGDLI